jgi:Domain of unknown function (DUF4157)
MPAFDHESRDLEAEREHRRRRADPDMSLLGQAAAQGRPDVAGPHGLLGLQRTVGNEGVASLIEEERSPVHDVVSSTGASLDAEVRGDMEARLGHDFSDVQVHSDSAAHESAQAVNARAYTVGSHVVFQRDSYDPSSAEGRKVLAHELTHVVQQRNGPVDGTSAPGGVRISDPSDRFEREASATAEQAMINSPPAAAATASSVQRTQDEALQTYLQRDEELEEEPAAQTYVQRDEEELEQAE